MRVHSFRMLALWAFALASIPAAARGALVVPGDLYSSNYFSTTIKHYTSGGVYSNSITLPSSYGSEVKGLAVGPDGWLYAVTTTSSGFGVVALDQTGTVQQTYSGPGYIAGNLSYGKIAFAANGQFFVAGANNLVRFTPGSPTGSVVYTNNQVFDVKGLPSGNLLVVSAYDLDEITTAGALVRSIEPTIRLVDARGVEYDPANNDIFVTMLGYTDQFFRLMRLDGTSGQVEKNVYFWYGDDLALTADSRLIVGSRTQAPGIFDLNLNQIGALNGGQQMFVTQAPVPEPSTLVLLGVGAIGLLAWAWRRRGSRRGEAPYLKNRIASPIIRNSLMTRLCSVLMVAALVQSQVDVAAAVSLRPGNIIVGDVFQHRIIDVDPETGVQTLIASGGLIDHPHGVAIDGSGQILVADSGGGLFRIDPNTGAQTAIAGADSKLARKLAIAPDGDIFLTQYYANVLRVDPVSGSVTHISTGGYLADPFGIAIDGDGYLLVGNTFESRHANARPVILRINPITGEQTSVSSGTALVQNVTDLVLDKDGQIIALGSVLGTDAPPYPGVFAISPATGAQMLLSSGGFLKDPYGIALDFNGDYLITDRGTHSVFRVDHDSGNQTLISQGNYFDGPAGICVVPVPEPSTLALLGVGAVGLLGYVLHRGKRARQR